MIIEKLTSEYETSRETIIGVLKQMQFLKPSDTFIFYVASHGITEQGVYYLLTSNVGSLSTRKLIETSLNEDEIKMYLGNIPSSKKMIIFDTCSSGAIGEGLQLALLTRGLSERTAIKLLSRAVGSTIISASKSNQEAIEGYKGHGLFTYVLAEGLLGKADLNRDKFIKTRELGDYVEDEVTEISETIFKHPQYPITILTGDTFPIAKVK